VRQGDTLTKIAGSRGVDGGWRALWSLNRRQIADPNLIRVGQRLAL
jgi:nucleoid-associated protein YgaU